MDQQKKQKSEQKLKLQLERVKGRMLKIDIAHPKALNTVHRGSKMIMLGAVVMLIATIVLAIHHIFFSQEDTSSNQDVAMSNDEPSVPTPLPTTIESVEKEAQDITKLSLDDPLVCQHESEEENINVEAYILDKNMYARINEQSGSEAFFLLNDDCVYYWNEPENVGEQLCGIGFVLDLAETFGEGLNVETLIELLGEINPNESIDKDVLQNLAASCSEGTIPEETFVVPTYVTFTEIAEGQIQNQEILQQELFEIEE